MGNSGRVTREEAVVVPQTVKVRAPDRTPQGLERITYHFPMTFPTVLLQLIADYTPTYERYVVVLNEEFGIVDAFDTETKSWQRWPPMRVPRTQFAALAVNGVIYVVGGRGWRPNAYSGRKLSSVECLVPGADCWQYCSSMVAPRDGHTAVAYKGRVYVFGGADLWAARWAAIESFDPLTNTWRCEPDSLIPWSCTFTTLRAIATADASTLLVGRHPTVVACSFPSSESAAYCYRLPTFEEDVEYQQRGARQEVMVNDQLCSSSYQDYVIQTHGGVVFPQPGPGGVCFYERVVV